MVIIMTRGKTKIELFEELAQIDKNGCSRWVSVEEFVEKTILQRM